MCLYRRRPVIPLLLVIGLAARLHSPAQPPVLVDQAPAGAGLAANATRTRPRKSAWDLRFESQTS
jgi:hypothetical protein